MDDGERAMFFLFDFGDADARESLTRMRALRVSVCERQRAL